MFRQDLIRRIQKANAKAKMKKDVVSDTKDRMSTSTKSQDGSTGAEKNNSRRSNFLGYPTLNKCPLRIIGNDDNSC